MESIPSYGNDIEGFHNKEKEVKKRNVFLKKVVDEGVKIYSDSGFFNIPEEDIKHVFYQYLYTYKILITRLSLLGKDKKNISSFYHGDDFKKIYINQNCFSLIGYKINENE